MRRLGVTIAWLMFCALPSVQADTFTSSASGNYNANATWGGAANPANGMADSVTIAANTVTITNVLDATNDTIGFSSDAAVLQFERDNATNFPMAALDLTGASPTINLGAVVQNNGMTHTLVAGALTLGGGRTLTVGKVNINSTKAYGLTINGTGTLTGTQTIIVNSNTTGTGTLTFPGSIGGPGSFVLRGPCTLALSGASTFSGGVTVSNGTLSLKNSQPLGYGPLTIAGGALDASVGGASLTTTNQQYWNSDIVFNGNASLNLGPGGVSLPANRQVTANASTLTIGGTIDDGGATYGLTKAGGGTLALAGSNSFHGGVVLNAGTLAINNAWSLGTNTFVIAGGSLDCSAAASITNAGNNAQMWNSDFTFAGTTNLDLGTGAVTLGSNRTVTVSANTLGVGGVIDDGPNTYGLVKNGAGRLLLYGTSTYGGTTTVSTGRLSLGPNGFVPGTPVLSGTGALGLNAAGNLTAGTKVMVGVNNLLTAESNIEIMGFADASSAGTLGVDYAAYSQNINMVSLPGMSLGTAAGGTIVSGVLTPAANTYRLGSAGTLNINCDNYLTGLNGLVVGGNVTINNAQNFTGATVVKSGLLTLANANALASSASVAVTGTVSHTTAVTLNNLSGTGNIASGAGNPLLTLYNTADTAFLGALDTAGNNGTDIAKNGGGTFTQQGNWDSKQKIMYVNAGGYVISGAGNQTFTYQSRGIIQQGAWLTLDNSGVNSTDRVQFNNNQSGGISGDCLQLNGGSLIYIGSGSTNSTEAVGNQSQVNYNINFGAGNSVLALSPGSGRSAIISFTGSDTTRARTFGRSAGASVLLKGTGLGTTAANAPGADSSAIVFANSSYVPAYIPASGSVLPGFVVDTVTGGADAFNLATYDYGTDATFGTADDVGFRGLKSGELTIDTLTGGTLSNVKLSSSVANVTSTNNTLQLANGGSITDGGSKTQTVTSGTILSTGAANSIGSVSSSDVLAFGVNEAIFYDAPGSTLTVNMRVTGSGGLTKGGDGTLVLSGSNTFSGGVWVNGGILSVSANTNVGSTAQTINLNNGGILQATASFTNSRSVVVGGATANTITSGGVSVTGSGNLSASGVISGVGRLVKTGTGTLTLSATNTYSGGTTITAGKLLVNGVNTNQGSIVVGTAGTLGGSGKIWLAAGQSVTIGSGGALEVNLSSGALTVNGNVDLSSGGNTVAFTGAPGGEKTLLNYTGLLSGTFSSFSNAPSGYRVDYATAGQIRLVLSRGMAVFFR